MVDNLGSSEVKSLNLRVLRKKYPEVQSIMYVVEYTTLYEFDSAVKIWHKLSIRGPLFICKLSENKGTKLVILNQKDNHDFEVDNVNSKFIEKNAEQQMIYLKGSDGFIRGLWIYEPTVLDELYYILERLRPPKVPVYCK